MIPEGLEDLSATSFLIWVVSSSRVKAAQEWTNRTPISHEHTSVHFLVLPGSLLSITKITQSDTSFKKTFCLMNIRPQDLLSHEPTLWFRRQQLFWFRRTIFLSRTKSLESAV